MAQIFRILHLTDLHITIDNLIPDKSRLKKNIITYFYPEKNVVNSDNPTRNFDTIIDLWDEIEKNIGNVDHVVITGDIANFGTKAEYDTALDRLIQLQKLIKERKHKRGLSLQQKADNSKLDPNLFTIVPGNHDRMNRLIAKNPKLWFWWTSLSNLIAPIKINRTIIKGYHGRIENSDYKNLELFHEYFGSTIEKKMAGGTNISINRKSIIEYPFYKKLFYNKIALVGLNTTLETPIHKTMLNALGTFTISQQSKLKNLLNKNLKNIDFCILLAHHYPYPISGAEESRIYLRFLYPERLLDILTIYPNEFLLLCGHIHNYRYVPVFFHTKLGPKIISGDTSTHRKITNRKLQIPIYIHEFKENVNNRIEHKHIVYKLEIGKKEGVAKYEIKSIIKQIPKINAERTKMGTIEEIELNKMKQRVMMHRKDVSKKFLFIYNYLKKIKINSIPSIDDHTEYKEYITNDVRNKLFTEYYSKRLSDIEYAIIVKRQIGKDDLGNLKIIMDLIEQVMEV